jgi:AcrR family transcriptional regulator
VPRSVREMTPGPSQVRAGGRRLDSSRDSAILQAALQGLTELGYDRLSMDEIAARAHAGKGAIYRRWPSKASLIVDALIRWREQAAPMPVPDTGSLRGDAEAIAASIPTLSHDMIGVVLGVATAAARDPELASALNASVMQRPRELLMIMVERAVTRGEIAKDRDLSLLPDIFVGLNVIRLMTGQPIDGAFVRRVFDQIVLPLATTPSPRRISATS